MTREEVLAEITALKSLLADTDYKDNKLTESLLVAMSGTGKTIDKVTSWAKTALTEYGETVTKRQGYRARINELEEMLGDE